MQNKTNDGNAKKWLVKALFSQSISRAVSKFIMRLSSSFGSALSYAKTYALFPTAFANDNYLDWTAEVGYPERVQLGKHVRIGPHAVLGAFGGVTIGDNVRLSRGVRLETGGLDFTAPAPFPHRGKPITIEDNVWIGTHAVILGGVTIGHGAVIGAQSVVTKNIPCNAVVAGNPAKVIKMIERMPQSATSS